jgi:hypothetical protein
VLPRLSDKLEDSCGNCINQYTPPTPYLKPDCTVSPLQVNYEHVKYYNGKVNCGNLFLEADIGGGINIPPAVIYPNDEINVDEYYILIMVDPDADLADNGSWNYDSPNPTPGNATFHEFSIPDSEFSQLGLKKIFPILDEFSLNKVG